MQIEFRECDWFNLWIWFEFETPPIEEDKQYLQQVLESWYTLGMLGGFNASSLMAQEAGVDISYLDYEPPDDPLPSLVHNMSPLDYEDCWGRCWCDLGTADALALDILLNALQTLSIEYVNLLRVIVGGQHETWAIPESLDDETFSNGYSDNHEDGSLA